MNAKRVQTNRSKKPPMKTKFVFVFSLALSVSALFAFYVLVGYENEIGYPSALGSAFRKGLEVSVALSVLNLLKNLVKDLKRKLLGDAIPLS